MSKTRTPVKTATQLGAVGLAAIVLALAPCGCSKSTSESPSAAPVLKPTQAANQLQQAFIAAPPEVRQTATTASEALRTADYDTAIRTLQVIKTRPDLTPEQQMALHESSATLEARLIEAAARGDPKAKAAYERWRKTRRN